MPIFTFQMGTENINKWEKAFNNLEKGRKMIGRKNRRLKQESETNSEAVDSFDGGNAVRNWERLPGWKGLQSSVIPFLCNPWIEFLVRYLGMIWKMIQQGPGGVHFSKVVVEEEVQGSSLEVAEACLDVKGLTRVPYMAAAGERRRGLHSALQAEVVAEL